MVQRIVSRRTEDAREKASMNIELLNQMVSEGLVYENKHPDAPFMPPDESLI